MAKDKKQPNGNNADHAHGNAQGNGHGHGPQNTIDLASSLCVTQGCKKKANRAQFCEEHFVWFKEGLVTKDGKRPIDFDKKYQAWLARQKAA